MAPRLDRIIETCLYVDELERAARFYGEVLGLATLTQDARFHAYDVGQRSVLLLERLVPGTLLGTLEDDEAATSAAATVMRQLWRPVPAGHPFPFWISIV